MVRIAGWGRTDSLIVLERPTDTEMHRRSERAADFSVTKARLQKSGEVLRFGDAKHSLPAPAPHQPRNLPAHPLKMAGRAPSMR